MGEIAKSSRKKVRESLLEQLEDMGVISDFFLDLIDDYMSFWDIKKDLQKDIKERGVSVEWRNSPTSFGFKKNDSISELIKTNGQMLKILQQLKISTDDETGDTDDEDDF